MAETSRSSLFCYAAARYVTNLDWVCASDHVSNKRSDLGRWKEGKAISNLWNEPGSFVTLPGYEASLKAGAGGDNNVYLTKYPDMFVDEYESGNVLTLCDKLKEKLKGTGISFFVVPHHTTRADKHGEISDKIYPGPDYMPVVEIYSKWGTSEYRGNPNPLQKIHPGPSYVRDFLNRGIVLGFIAGTDSHATMPSGEGEEASHITSPPGFTAVLTNKLTRQTIFEGIQSWRCYASSKERIYLDFSVSGVCGGQTIPLGSIDTPRKIRITTAACSTIRKIEIIRNGKTIYTRSPENWHDSFSFSDDEKLKKVCLDSKHIGKFVYYYARVTCAKNARAWASPVWIQV